MLEVENLNVHIRSYEGNNQVLDSVSFEVRDGEILGLIGETGCGKSLTALAIPGLLPRRARITSGQIRLDGENLLAKSGQELRGIRGRRIAMIFQQPRMALNPVVRVGDQVARVLAFHRGVSNADAWRETIALLRRLGMPDPERRARAYPHELSGGMCQRVLIAMMLAPAPQLLIADEPTTALDPTIETQILDLLRDVQQERRMSMLYITHDIGIVAQLCDRIAVMHAGHIVEVGKVADLFARPLHPYTRALIGSVLRVDRPRPLGLIERIPGTVPSLINPPRGCRFADRCAFVMDRCRLQRPDWIEAQADHFALCQKEVIGAHESSGGRRARQALPGH